MRIFSPSSKTIVAWGPTAAVNVKISALGSVVDDTWLLTNLSVGMREITDVRQCFNETSYIYALGNNQSSCSIGLTFVIFIGTRDCRGNGNSAVGNIADGLNMDLKNRISRNTSPSSITIGSFSCMGWLIGADVSGLDPERGVCYGTVQFIMEMPEI